MKLLRHKYYKKDELKVKLTDQQYHNKINYLTLLASKQPLPPKALDYALIGEHKNFRKFHLGGDILIIYTIKNDTLYLQRQATHSQLFK